MVLGNCRPNYIREDGRAALEQRMYRGKIRHVDHLQER